MGRIKTPPEKPKVMTRKVAHAYALMTVHLLWDEIVTIFVRYNSTPIRNDEAVRAARLMIHNLAREERYLGEKNRGWRGGYYYWAEAIAYSVHQRRIFLYNKRNDVPFTTMVKEGGRMVPNTLLPNLHQEIANRVV